MLGFRTATLGVRGKLDFRGALCAAAAETCDASEMKRVYIVDKRQFCIFFLKE